MKIIKIVLYLTISTLTIQKVLKPTAQKTQTKNTQSQKPQKNTQTRNLNNEGQITLTNNPPFPQAGQITPQKTRAVFNYNSYPLQMGNPFNLHSFNNIYNPNSSHLTGASPLHVAALGLHPFVASGMTLPFTNPYMMMNPMMMGSMGGANSMNQMNVPGTAPFYNVNAAQTGGEGNRKMMKVGGKQGGMMNPMQMQGGMMNPNMQGMQRAMMNPNMQGMMNPNPNMQGMQGGMMNPNMQGMQRAMRNPNMQGMQRAMMNPNMQGMMNPNMGANPQMGQPMAGFNGNGGGSQPPQMMQNFPGMDRSLFKETNNDKGLYLEKLNNINKYAKQQKDMEGIVGIGKRGLGGAFYDNRNQGNSDNSLLGSITNGMPLARMNQMLKMGIKPRKLKENIV